MRKFLATMLALLGIGGAASTQAQAKPQAEMSGDLRAMLFKLSASDIGITHGNYHNKVWGVVMETDLETGYYTLVALADGSTFSTGGGIIGAGEHKSVRDASAAFIDSANSHVSQAQPSADHFLPLQARQFFTS